MANLKLIDALLEKTEYIYVLGIDGKPQMPTNRKVRIRSLFKSGRAKIVDTVPFTIRLLYENDAVLQPITIAEDPGRTNIGAAVLTQLGDLVFSAVVETRNKSIKKLMTDRKAHRHASRRGERKARQRLAKKHGSMTKAGMMMRKLPQYAADKFVTCKIIKNTEARFCNRKRMPDWLTPTVNHLVQTHINLIKKIEKYLPITDVAIEVNRFAFMQMENPGISGVDFQNGPLKGFDDIKAAIREQQHGKCLMCKNDIEHFHHIVPRSKGGSDTIQNQAGLCKKCHAKVHTDSEFLAKFKDKKEGLIKKYGALSALNQAVPFICKELIKIYGVEHVHFCTGKDTSLIRSSLGYEKTKENQMHEVDAYCIGLAAIGADKVKRHGFNGEREVPGQQKVVRGSNIPVLTSHVSQNPRSKSGYEPERRVINNVFKIKQFRRQDRQRVHYQKERTYYLDGKKIATSRKPRFEQKGNALSDWYKEQIEAYGQHEAGKMRSRLTVKKSKRSYNTAKKLMPGCIFYYDGQRHVMTGQSSYGRYLRAYNCGTKDFLASKCQIIQFNTGLVFV